MYNYKSNVFYKKIVKEINLNMVKPPRAGVILYTKMNNEFYFGLGIDNDSKELTDFGGGISYKERDKNVIEGALREFKEETLGIFGHIQFEDVLEAPIIYNNDILILFKYTDLDPNFIRNEFLIAYQHHQNCEVSDIVWLSTSELKHQIMTRGKMFSRVQNFLQKAGNFYWIL